ncbi:unnamed protein product, partial [Mesorhabditis belari]|uniref:Peptidase C1A papain C-terminal domain-containing protein n=1 Tax=Mesorhabditis belari TaxID=2138241 RepID=A0AAF3FM26_9BILA
MKASILIVAATKASTSKKEATLTGTYKYFFWYGGGGDRRYRTTSTPVTPQRMDVGDFDWRTTGAVNPICDQGQCGACWSFAAVAAIETTSNYVNGRLNTERRSYSEQVSGHFFNDSLCRIAVATGLQYAE